MPNYSNLSCMDSHIQNRLDWGMLPSFLAIVRTGRLTAAAAQLRIDHSTLSRRIQQLEEGLQAQLFDRRAQGYKLTPQGERLLDFAQKMENLAFMAMSEVGTSRLRVAGEVRVGATDGLGSMFLAPRLTKLRDAHPDLEIQLIAMSRLASISKREADIAIVLSPPSEGRLHVKKLTDYELALYATREYLEEHEPIVDRLSLHDHRIIGYVQDLVFAPEVDYLPLLSPEVKTYFSSSNILAQYYATVSGGGLCILPKFMAIHDGRLERVLAQEFSLTRSFWLIVHSDMRDLARVRIVSDFIVHEVRNAPDVFLPARDDSAAR
jgi:DNA-binding transcriptional LysR family regulator